ncbi:7255_t:CDS:10 [Diversispora eburnea]|uniref:7255_t:CDS:1 n=1 Tax=Diversispora eburnea TaxID=1213867 RepID=A0A9N8V2A8_9GLOM|nr:7255_t:CDS:10 [Diversispora eburnea]
MIIGLCVKSNKWSWRLNAHLSAFYSTFFLCSTWQIRTAFKLESNEYRFKQIEIITAVCNLIFSLIITSIAITTPKGPPIFQDGRAVSALEYCSILDYISFNFVTPFMIKTYSLKTFQDSDLNLLPFSSQAKILHKIFKNTQGNKLLYRIWKSNQHRPENGLYEWCFIYLLGMFLSNVLLQLDISQLWYWSSSVFQLNLKGMLNSEIYSKIDTSRVSEFAVWWWSVIDSPIELAFGIYLLYQFLGVACLFGLLAMIFTLPINHYTAKYYAKTQDDLMNARDRRVNLMNEILQGIRMIKFFAWEKKWESKVSDARESELKQLRYNFIYLAMFDLLWMLSPILVTIVSLFFFTKVQEQELTVSIAFTTISIFNELRFALNILPELFIEALQASISLKRINKFLHEDEIVIPSDDLISQAITSIGFEEATVTWNKQKEEKEENNNNLNKDAEFTIRDLNLDFPIGELSIICGPTGSGKTLLLLSLLRETYLMSGKIHCPVSPPDNYTDKNLNPINWIIPNCVAYVAQQAWLQNASIRDNILFGLPHDETRYLQVVKMCALEKDFEIFEDGDLTEIGEKGITLSGGQKQRVSLARAVYSRAKHIFMDDVLSSVDAHTVRHLVTECLKGDLMKGRTQILVTHHVRFCLSYASYLVNINNGKVSAADSVSKLRDSGLLSSLLEDSDRQIKLEDPTVESIENISQSNSDANPAHNPDSSISSDATLVENENQVPAKKSSKPKVLVDEEERPSGMVRMKIYKTYFRANGHILFWFIVAIFFSGTRGLQVLESWWLKVWSEASIPDSNRNGTSPTILDNKIFRNMNADYIFSNINVNNIFNNVNVNNIFSNINEQHSVNYYLNIYVAITLATVFFGISRFLWLYYGSLKASRKLYRRLLHRIIRAPLRFFDTTPIGRILNRFNEFGWFLTYAIMMISTIMVITAITYEFIVAAIIFGIMYILIGMLYAKASRELKRMDSTTRSPLYSHFTESLIGITTIRAFGAAERFMQEMLSKIDNNLRPFFYVWIVNRWLSIRYNISGAFITFLAGLFIILNLERIDAGLAGLSLSFAMYFSEQIMWSVRRFTSLEMSLNAVERVSEFSEIPQEAPAIIEPRPPANWPHSGAITVQDLQIRYAPDLEPVLHHISFSVNGQEKVGIVGRTGSGKSTIALSLFRFIEPSEGKIFIDGIDVSTIGVEDLRSRITIIPQDPILFTGSIRSNLDAFSQYEDSDIFESMRRVHLIPSEDDSESSIITGDNDNINTFKNLDTPVSEGGKNFSQGQRQLLCLARALLRRTKIILMDEATASIDFSIDEKIQKMIRTEFVDCTVICIAHRLRTVIDYDRILVLDNGNIREFDRIPNPHFMQCAKILVNLTY